MGKHKIIWLTECDSLGKPHTALDQSGSSGEEGKNLAFSNCSSPAARPQQTQYPYSCLAWIKWETSDKSAAAPLPPQCNAGLREEKKFGCYVQGFYSPAGPWFSRVPEAWLLRAVPKHSTLAPLKTRAVAVPDFHVWL